MFEAARQRSNQTDSPPQGQFLNALPKYQISTIRRFRLGVPPS